jgi:hypothetical protein
MENERKNLNQTNVLLVYPSVSSKLNSKAFAITSSAGVVNLCLKMIPEGLGVPQGWVKTLSPFCSHQNFWVNMDVHPPKNAMYSY